MKNLIISTILLFTILVSAQKTQWQKNFGGSHADYLYDAMPTLDYGFIMVGGTLSNNTGDVGKSKGDYDFFITKVSEYGNLEWTATLGGDKQDVIKCITNTYDGGFLVAGISNSGVSDEKSCQHIGMQDIWLVKITIEGTIAWQKTLGGLANENVNDVIKTKDGNFIIAGTSASDGSDYDDALLEDKNLLLKKGTNRGNLDYWLVKVNQKGELLWEKSYGGKYADVLQKVVELPSGNLLVAGTSNSPMGEDKNTKNLGLNDWWILQLDKNGNELWQKSFGAEGDDQLTSCLLTNDKNILLGGNKRSFDREGKGNSDFALVKIDSLGTTLWEETYNEGKNDFLTDIVQNKDSTFLVSGYTASRSKPKLGLKKVAPTAGTEDFFVLKLQANGEEDWRKSIGTDKKEVLKKTIETRDGGYVLMGSSIPFNNLGNNDANFYIVKLLDKDKPKPKKLPLEAIPNPTRAYTQIVLGNDYTTGTVLVSDYAGRILQRFTINGKRIIPINLENYADGTYIISVETDIDSNSAKVIKIKK